MIFENNTLRTPIEEAVSLYTGRAWRIRDGKDLADLACKLLRRELGS